MTGADILTGGGVSTLLAAVVFVIAQFVKSRSDRSTKAGGLFADAASANAVLTSSLRTVEASLRVVAAENVGLRSRVDELARQIDAERTEHREELALLRTQLEAVSARLAAAEAKHKDGAL